ncbi:hypothetical protein P875_00075758 [Aspergillus parasiticus SU-1]|uniref:Uncharacterized protein n=2 Tax=Aspergillus parasiticus TaxID=5067 RepID=A0A5N6DBF2_ASPPA|nr:hypothetical protein BDV34DRAFT_200686 [Aspergillus parasiticus]KJK68767.1 hypothetical protein P875_00075758 [Aspergillus parasiticus SU-1]
MFSRTLPATTRLFSTAGKTPAGIPVIVCGKTSQIGDVVREVLQPEYEVTHLFLSPATAKNEIPALLRQTGSTTSTESGNSPAAIIMGGGYTQTDLEEIRAASQGPDAKPVAWLKVDPAKTPSSIPVGPEYGRAVAKRTKDRLDELVRDGGIDRDEVHFI